MSNTLRTWRSRILCNLSLSLSLSLSLTLALYLPRQLSFSPSHSRHLSSRTPSSLFQSSLSFTLSTSFALCVCVCVSVALVNRVCLSRYLSSFYASSPRRASLSIHSVSIAFRRRVSYKPLLLSSLPLSYSIAVLDRCRARFSGHSLVPSFSHRHGLQ